MEAVCRRNQSTRTMRGCGEGKKRSTVDPEASSPGFQLLLCTPYSVGLKVASSAIFTMAPKAKFLCGGGGWLNVQEPNQPILQ